MKVDESITTSITYILNRQNFIWGLLKIVHRDNEMTIFISNAESKKLYLGNSS